MDYRYSHIEREVQVYGYDSVVKSHCRMCHGGCGVIIYKKEGKVAKIAGDPGCPINHGTLCTKGIASPQLVYHPERLSHPVRRIGAKGSGRWQRLTWDEALDEIAAKILEYKNNFGAESIVMGYGTGRENEAVIYRFANLLGTPNMLTAGHFCYGPRIATGIITCGTNPIVDYENHPRCIMLWGNNLVISNPDKYKGEPFSVSLSKGAKLIVVDPRMTRTAARADIWLELRPGTDTALALGMLHVIINERLHDDDFVKNHVHGWEPFVRRVNAYPPEKVAAITWVPEEKIVAAARLYATTKPAGIQWGVAIEQQVNCADNDRVLLALMGITGNLDIPGGQVLFRTPNINNVGRFGAHDQLSKDQAKKRLGGDRFRLAGHFGIINPKCVWDAVVDENPYPVKMLFLISTNPLLTRANAADVQRALERVPFMVVSDFFLTPTGKLELYSTLLEKWGYDPLPQYREPPESPINSPEICKDYPYILITGRRLPGFFHSENRQLPWLRELHPDPVVEIHSEMAQKEGIVEGDWVIIESPRGKVRQKARLFDGMDPRIVSAEHAWWFPEKKEFDPAWQESNINILTDNAFENCDQAMGATSVRTLLCRIYPEKRSKV